MDEYKQHAGKRDDSNKERQIVYSWRERERKRPAEQSGKRWSFAQQEWVEIAELSYNSTRIYS